MWFTRGIDLFPSQEPVISYSLWCLSVVLHSPWYPSSSVHWLSRVWFFVTPWTAARQASLSITNSRSLCKLMSIESVMPSNHLTLCRPLLLPPSVFPSTRVFSNESVLLIRWPKYNSQLNITLFSTASSPAATHIIYCFPISALIPETEISPLGSRAKSQDFRLMFHSIFPPKREAGSFLLVSVLDRGVGRQNTRSFLTYCDPSWLCAHLVLQPVPWFPKLSQRYCGLCITVRSVSVRRSSGASYSSLWMTSL